MSALGYAYFYVCATLAVLGAIATIAAKNPIRGAMGLLLMILSIAGLFLALHAQFLAAIQLIVYAGAIVVLFLFVIMLLGPSASTPLGSPRANPARPRRGLVRSGRPRSDGAPHHLAGRRARSARPAIRARPATSEASTRSVASSSPRASCPSSSRARS